MDAELRERNDKIQGAEMWIEHLSLTAEKRAQLCSERES